MSDEAPPPTEPAADSLNSNAPPANLEGAAQEAVATDSGTPLDLEIPSVSTNVETSAHIDSEIKDIHMGEAPSDQPLSSEPRTSSQDDSSLLPSPPSPLRQSTKPITSPSSVFPNPETTRHSNSLHPHTETTQQSSAPVASAATPDSASNAPSPTPVPARVGTPLRNANPNANGEGDRTSSRAASVHPDTGFTMPTEAPVHGAPVRQYINSKITAVLLEGMKKVAKEQPPDPLRVLGEFLLERSKELENTKP